ncbi:MAG: hypothetical protein AAGH15_09735 [Myxococcota bacterium]
MKRWLMPALAGLLASACGSDASSTIEVSAFALMEARNGITAEQSADGYSVTFTNVIVEFEGFYARTTGGLDAGLDPSPVLAELVPSGAAGVYVFEGVDARRWDEVGYASVPPPADVQLMEGVDPELAQLMIDEGWSQLIVGTMTAPDGAVFPFEFGFPVAIEYTSCRSGTDLTFGIVAPVNGVAEVELTWHLTHLFFDSFGEDSSLRMEPFAAVYDGVNPIRTDDLEQQPLANLVDRNGDLLIDATGNPVLFVPPRLEGRPALTLRDHMLGARFGHFNGLEGFCTTSDPIIFD